MACTYTPQSLNASLNHLCMTCIFTKISCATLSVTPHMTDQTVRIIVFENKMLITMHGRNGWLDFYYHYKHEGRLTNEHHLPLTAYLCWDLFPLCSLWTFPTTVFISYLKKPVWSGLLLVSHFVGHSSLPEQFPEGSKRSSMTEVMFTTCFISQWCYVIARGLSFAFYSMSPHQIPTNYVEMVMKDWISILDLHLKYYIFFYIWQTSISSPDFWYSTAYLYACHLHTYHS